MAKLVEVSFPLVTSQRAIFHNFVVWPTHSKTNVVDTAKAAFPKKKKSCKTLNS